MQPCERGFNCRFVVLRQASRAVDPVERSLNYPALGQDNEPFYLFIGPLDDRDGDAVGFERRALRFVALITSINERHFHPRALKPYPYGVGRRLKNWLL